MVVVYATLILNGSRTMAQVPATLQAAVKQTLLDLGLDENGQVMA